MKEAIVIEKRTVQHFAAGSPTAFRTIYDAYKDKIFSYCLKFTKSVPDAEEVVQQSFIRLWEYRKSIDSARPLGPYIYRIVRNCAFDYLKEVARTAQLKADVRSATRITYYEENIRAADYEKIAEEAIDTLPEKRQIIFRMSYNDGMSHQEIADALELSVHTVKSQLVKATKAFRVLMLQHAQVYSLVILSILIG